MAIHDHDLGRAGGAGAPHRRIDLLGVEAATFLVHLMPTGHLLPLDDARDTFHVADDVDAHPSSPLTVGHLLEQGLYFARLAPVEQQGYQNYHAEGNGAGGFGDVKFLKHRL